MNICTRSEAVGHDPPNRSWKSFEAAIQFAATPQPSLIGRLHRRVAIAPAAIRSLWERGARLEYQPGAPVHPCLGVRLRIAWLARLLSLVPNRRRARAHLRPPAWPGAATLKSAPARKCDDKRAEQAVAAENRRLTRTTDPTTISYGYGRQRCRRLRVWRRDRRVRRFGGLQRDNRCLWRCVGNSGAWALRGVGARGARRARAADQVDR